MKIVLGCPALNQHDITEQLAEELQPLIASPHDFTFVIVDNNSLTKYPTKNRQLTFKVDVMRNKTNAGYYYPLKQLYNAYPEADLIGLMHNDVRIYDNGFDTKLKEAFKKDKNLGLVSLYGSRQVNSTGKDGSAVGNFNDRNINKKFKVDFISKVTPVLTVDSLFMLFKREAIPLLNIQEDILLCHYYDKIWPFRLMEHGFRTAAVPVNFNHHSNVTSQAQEYYKSAQEWFKNRGVDVNIDAADFLMRFEGMLRYQIEYRDLKGMFPSKIAEGYKVTLI